jgi:hypothetical protein
MNLKKLSKNSSTTTNPADLASEATRSWSRGEIIPHGDYYLTAWLDKGNSPTTFRLLEIASPDRLLL